MIVNLILRIVGDLPQRCARLLSFRCLDRRKIPQTKELWKAILKLRNAKKLNFLKLTLSRFDRSGEQSLNLN